MKRIKHNILGIITRPQRPSAIITLSSHTPAQGKGVKEGYTVAAGEAREAPATVVAIKWPRGPC